MNRKIFISESSEQTKNLGRDIAKKLKGGRVIALYGELGSGKTTFAQGLAEGLGIERRIISPTFIMVRNYELGIKNHELGRNNFYHIDLYRTKSEKDLEGLGLEEIINNPENIVAIEWAEKMGYNLPKKRLEIRFYYIDKDKRRIEICPKVE